MQINKKQELILWISGIILASFTYWIFYQCTSSLTMNLTLETIDKKLPGRAAVWLVEGNIGLTIMTFFQFVVPFLILIGLLLVSLRTRKK